jgi:hypothetical protein
MRNDQLAVSADHQVQFEVVASDIHGLEEGRQGVLRHQAATTPVAVNVGMWILQGRHTGVDQNSDERNG